MINIPSEQNVPVNVLKSHKRQVEEISKNIKRFHAAQTPFRLFHGSTNSTRASSRTQSNVIDTSRLDNVLHVDTSERTALVEPNVSMSKLVEATLKHGLLPPVVMEFPAITVGGGFTGTSFESSSFKYGWFDRTVAWIEFVCANGDVIAASADLNADLFYSAASSFGTLGVTVLLKIALIEAKPYVELTYTPASNVMEALGIIEQATADTSVQFIDGIFYSQTKGVVCTGKLKTLPEASIEKNENNPPIQGFTRRSDPWFYRHAEKLLTKTKDQKTKYVELVPVTDYLFRYDRGGFWVGRFSFSYFLVPFNRITRYLLDSLLHVSNMYHCLHKSDLARSYLIQDVEVPYDDAEDFFSFLESELGRYPIWLCPILQKGQPPLFSKGLQQQDKDMKRRSPNMMLNFGIWTSCISPRSPGYFSRREFADLNRRIEGRVHEAGGRKCLYAHVYYTEDEFWEIYDKQKYDSVRQKWHATYLPSVWDKVKEDVEKENREMQESWLNWMYYVFWSIWPLAGVYGVFHALLTKDYLLKRKST